MWCAASAQICAAPARLDTMRAARLAAPCEASSLLVTAALARPLTGWQAMSTTAGAYRFALHVSMALDSCHSVTDHERL